MNIKSTCKYNSEHVFQGETTQELIRDIKNHEKTCLSDPVDIINRLEGLKGEIEDPYDLLSNLIYRLYGFEPERDKEQLKLAKEIIAKKKIPEHINPLSMRFSKMCIPFQCFDNCTRSRYENGLTDAKYELYPGKRFVLVRADAEDLQDKGYGWIIE